MTDCLVQVGRWENLVHDYDIERVAVYSWFVIKFCFVVSPLYRVHFAALKREVCASARLALDGFQASYHTLLRKYDMERLERCVVCISQYGGRQFNPFLMFLVVDSTNFRRYTAYTYGYEAAA